MISVYLARYDDYIRTNEMLYHLKTEESLEELTNMIISVLVNKYKMPINDLIMSILNAIKFNYGSTKLYIQILNHLSNEYQIFSKRLLSIEVLDFASNYLKKDHTNNMINLWIETSSEALEVQEMIKNDDIQKFKVYALMKPITDISIAIPCFQSLSPIEACCYFGSVNIFYYLKTNMNTKITKKCIRYSFIGGNIAIINECQVYHQIDKICLKFIIYSHNITYFEYILERFLSKINDFDLCDIVNSSNLKAMILFLAKHNNNVFSIDTIKRKIIRYTIQKNIKEIIELIL